MRFLSLRIIVSIVAVLQLTSLARADLITNGSFEWGPFTPNGNNAMSLDVGSPVIPGWTVINAEIAWLKNANPFDILASDGAILVDLTGIHDHAPYGGVSQSIATIAGADYILEFDLGSFESNGLFSGPVAVTASAAGTSTTFTTSPSGSGNQWQTFSLAFTAISNMTDVSLVGVEASPSHGRYFYIGLDRVSVELVNAVSSTPEPASMALLGLTGLGGIGLRWHQRRKTRCAQAAV
jgi:hypothetical protein